MYFQAVETQALSTRGVKRSTTSRCRLAPPHCEGVVAEEQKTKRRRRHYDRRHCAREKIAPEVRGTRGVQWDPVFNGTR